MSKTDFSSIQAVIKQLRVPELNYQQRMSSLVGNEEDIDVFEKLKIERLEQEQQTLNALSEAELGGQYSLLKTIQTSCEYKPLSAEFNNIAFFIDRVFDVWLRKSSLPNSITHIVNAWRYSFFKLMYFSFKDKVQIPKITDALRPLMNLIHDVTESSIGWSEVPQRSREILLNELNEITLLLNCAEAISFEAFSGVSERWSAFDLKQKNKFSKITERLIAAEERQAWHSCCVWYAHHYLYLFFSRHQLPSSVHQFLDEYWFKVLKENVQVVDKGGNKSLALTEKIESLNKDLVVAFTKKDDAAFKLADHILDDIQTEIEGLGIKVDPDVSISLELSLLIHLKDSDEEKSHFKHLPIDSRISEMFGEFTAESIQWPKEPEATANLGAWFIAPTDEEPVPFQLLSNFEKSRSLLFCNYLGIKTKEYSQKVFSKKLKEGQVKPLIVSATFSDVFKSTVKGLLKVAETQKNARVKAAEKAKAEAEKLLAEKLKAEEFAVQKASEIAVRTQELQQKRADKQRLELEKQYFDHVTAFKLGAWILIKEGGSELRFKLVVKLVALGKYIFVDKLGIKKREFLQEQLVNGLIDKDIIVISDGAEFEDSLERVVSRLRLSK